MASADLTLDAPRTPPAIRAVLTLVGVIIAGGLVLMGAYTLLDLVSRHTFSTRSTYSGVRSLVVDDESGGVSLTSAPAGAQVVVVEHLTKGLTSPHREVVRGSHGALHLKASCSGFPGPECDVRYVVAVPSGVSVLVNSGAGDISASGLITSASVQLSSGAGEVSVTRISAPQVQLSSGAGDVTAQFTRPAQRLVASSGAGDVHLTVPNFTYAVHASTGAGVVSDATVRTDPGSPRTISATSGAGDVTISANR